MLIITNRNFIANEGDEDMFGDKFNEEGPDELRLATADRLENGQWKLKLLSEPKEQAVVEGKTIWRSETEFKKIQKKGKDCIIFIHGFNQTFKKNLEKAYKLEEIYGLEVIIFSWPSHPKVKSYIIIDKKLHQYRKAKKNAKISVVALDRMFEKINNYLIKYQREDCETSTNLLIHSLGNYLFQNYVQSSHYERETAIFDNIILHQADADNRNHHQWVDTLTYGERIYITINEDDKVLKFSKKYNGEKRIGSTDKRLKSKEAIYVDFTEAKHVENEHGIFKKDEGSLKNPNVKAFFSLAFAGKKAHTNIPYNPHTNAHEVS